MKNKVTDYLTIDEVCDAIGIKRNSKAQITRWIKDGRIAGAYKFGKTWAIPINWVKSECTARGIVFHEVELTSNENEVKLNDYISIDEFVRNKDVTYQKIYNDIIDGRIKDFVRLGTSYGIKKEGIK